MAGLDMAQNKEAVSAANSGHKDSVDQAANVIKWSRK